MSTHNITLSKSKRNAYDIFLNTIMSAAMGSFWFGTQELIRNSCGERAISVRATEVLLYFTREDF